MIFDEPEFETDEEYKKETEEQDKENAGLVDCQNKILDTMQKTLLKMTNELKKNRKPNRNMAQQLKNEILNVHEVFEGLNPDYEYKEDPVSCNDSKSMTTKSMHETSDQI